jgi:hypothetical protein
VREAEIFRNDYRNKERRNVFHALEKPLPFVDSKVASLSEEYTERSDEMETLKFNGAILFFIIGSCGIIATLIISRQNRMTR